MTGRSAVVSGLALLVAGFAVAGCDRGHVAGAGGGSFASSAASVGVDPAVAARKAACAAFRDAVAGSNTANQVFVHAADDPKRVGAEYDKPMTDAANAAAVIFVYVSDQIESAVTPGVPQGLSRKLMDFVQILQERGSMYAQHQSGESLNASAAKYTPAVDELLKECPAGSSDDSPPKLPVVSASSADEAKQKFCAAFTKHIQQTEDGIKRFAATTHGDEHHPDPQWKDPDQWLAGQGADTGLVFKYVANTLEASMSPQLAPDVADKGTALVAAIRKYGGLFTNHASGDEIREGVNEPGGYSETAEAVDAACGGS